MKRIKSLVLSLAIVSGLSLGFSGCGSNIDGSKGQSAAEAKRRMANDIKAISYYNDQSLYNESLRVSNKWCKWCTRKGSTPLKGLEGECQRMCTITKELRKDIHSGSKVDVHSKMKEDARNASKRRGQNYCQDLSESLYSNKDRERFISNCQGTKAYERVYGK